jgi:hypothetical protein
MGPELRKKYSQLPIQQKAAIMLDNVARIFYELREILGLIEKPKFSQ